MKYIGIFINSMSSMSVVGRQLPNARNWPKVSNRPISDINAFQHLTVGCVGLLGYLLGWRG